MSRAAGGGRPGARRTGVLVVGAGPVGLLLAGELRVAGVPVTVVDRLAAPTTESRASQLSTLTAELLAERGVDALLAEAVPEPGGHVAGLRLDLTGLPSAWAGNWKVPQYRTEAVLAERAEKLGATIHRPYELVGLEQRDGSVRCTLDTPDGARTVEAGWVVGCDGTGSTVRELAGIATDRTAATLEMLRADVTGVPIPTRRFERTGRGLAVAMTRDGVTRVMVHELGRPPVARAGPPSFDEVVRRWRAVTGDDIAAGTPVWVDAFDNERALATEYRRGRVLLAGDAAHWHLPIGGQALNTGLQDAVGLGWRLAGWAPPGLLDSYARERRAVAARVLDAVAAQELLLLGGPEVDPVREVLAELLRLEPAGRLLAEAAANLDIRYEPGDHPLVGGRLAGVSTGEEPVLLRPGSPAPDRTVRLTSGCRLRLVHRDLPAAAGTSGVLLRPDGYVVWAAGGAGDAGPDAALRDWFGGTLP